MTAVVIDGVVLGRFLSLDRLYKDVHVLRRKCFIVYKEVLRCKFCRCVEVRERVGTSGMILGEKHPQMPA